MALPKIDIPTYTTKLPLTGLEVTYRPLLVKEEKIILMATQADDEKEINQAILQILTNCILSKLNIKELPIADVEWLIIQIRDKSLGGKQEVEFICNAAKPDTTVCSHRFKCEVDFNALETIYPKEKLAPDKVQLSKTLGIKLKPPSFQTLNAFEKIDAEYDFEVLNDVVEYVYDNEQTYKFSEQSKLEKEEFLNSLTRKHIEKITEYLESMPRFEVNVKHKCEACGFNHDLKVRDLANFFQ